MGTLTDKGRHDDELIDALMVRPAAPAMRQPGSGPPKNAPPTGNV